MPSVRLPARRRRTLRRLRLGGLASLGIAAGVALSACVPAPPPPPSSSPEAVDDLVARHQSYRTAHGLPGLEAASSLATNAQFHANRLAANGSCSGLSHSPELGDWYGGYAWGENVACISGCPADGRWAFDLWMNSPGHAANVANPAYGRIGVGIACNGAVEMAVAHYRSP